MRKRATSSTSTPPFFPLNPTSNFTDYTMARFGVAEQRQLRWLIDDLTERGVLVMLSNSDVDWVHAAYETARYAVGDSAGGRRGPAGAEYAHHRYRLGAGAAHDQLPGRSAVGDRGACRDEPAPWSRHLSAARRPRARTVRRRSYPCLLSDQEVEAQPRLEIGELHALAGGEDVVADVIRESGPGEANQPVDGPGGDVLDRRGDLLLRGALVVSGTCTRCRARGGSRDRSAPRRSCGGRPRCGVRRGAAAEPPGPASPRDRRSDPPARARS